MKRTNALAVAALIFLAATSIVWAATYGKTITVPSGISGLVATVQWSSVTTSGEDLGSVTMNLTHGGTTYVEFGANVTTSVMALQDLDLSLPITSTRVKYHEEIKEMRVENPEEGEWVLGVSDNGADNIRTIIWLDQ